MSGRLCACRSCACQADPGQGDVCYLCSTGVHRASGPRADAARKGLEDAARWNAAGRAMARAGR